MGRRRLQTRLLLAASLCAVARGLYNGVHEASRDRFVVQLALDETATSTEDAQEALPSSGSRGDSGGAVERVLVDGLGALPTRRVVNVSIQGHPFKCQLPTKGARSRQRQQRALRHIASLRAASLRGRCFKGSEEASSFELCVGDHVSVEGRTAAHVAEKDRPLEGGGFQQQYLGTANSGGNPLNVLVRCSCLLPSSIEVPEPLCRPGDVVQAFRESERQQQTAVVAKDGIFSDDIEGEMLLVSWLSKPWPRPMANDSSVDDRLIRRSEAIASDNRPCDEVVRKAQGSSLAARATDAVLDAARLEASGSASGEAEKQADFTLGIQLSAVNCCGLRALRAPQPEVTAEAPTQPAMEFLRLLEPLAGECLRVASGWWIYELCWPWRVRQLRHAISGEVEGTGVLLGQFSEGGSQGLELKKAAARQEGQRHELVTNIKGDTCERLVQKWGIALSPTPHSAESDIPAVGSSFNPLDSAGVKGLLVHIESNIDGCKPFEEGLNDAIVLLKRGNCWFHTKAMHAQAAGAGGLIIYNDQHQMIEVMEGVEEMPSPMIPTVLVERTHGTRLQKVVGSQISIAKSSVHGLSSEEVQRPISTSVIFHCGADWHHRSATCEVGDEVDVKLPPPPGSVPGSRWPLSEVRVLKAKIEEIDVAQKSLNVTWLAPPEGGDEDDGDLPAVIQSNWAYYEGVPCDSSSSNRIELITEPQACHTEFVVHVAELCAHPRLAPPQPREAQVISCSAHESTREAISKKRKAAEEKIANEQQSSASD